jgi:EmrB/QacA subfamily drug resistance transporter
MTDDATAATEPAPAHSRAAASEAADQNPTNPRRWIGLLFISLAVSLVIVDSTIVNVAVPSIVRDLQITSTEIQWVQEAYTLVFAALLMVFGALADRFGRRRMLTIGLTLFTLSSIAAGMAESGELLILSRIVQGIGGAMVLPTTLSLVNAEFRGKERGIAFAIWGSTIGGMVAVGPLLGGWLATDFSWRWAFGINIPLGIIIIAGLYWAVTESRDTLGRGRIDWVGAALSVVTSASLVYGLIEGRTYGWWLVNKPFSVGDWTWPFDISVVPVAFAVSLASLVAYITHGLARQRAGKNTLIAFSLFAIPSFRNGNIVATVVSMGEFGIILALPLWLQFVKGLNPFESGLIIVSLAVGSFVASGAAGALGQRVTNGSVIVQIGLALEIIGVVGMGFTITPEGEPAALIPWMFVYGMGVGFATAQLTGVIMRDVPVEQSGQGSGTQSTSRQVGSALGIAIIGTVLFTTAQLSLESSLKDTPLPAELQTQLVAIVIDSAGGAIEEFDKDPANANFVADSRAAISAGASAAGFTAAGFLGLGLLSSLSLGSRRTRQ